FDVLGASAQMADRTTEVPGERAQAAARELRENTDCDVVEAHDVERVRAAGEAREERALELREVRDGRRGLSRERGRVGRELAPRVGGGNTRGDEAVGDSRDPRDRGRHVLAVGELDQSRARLERPRAADSSPPELEEVSAWRGERRLAVDDH